MKSLNIPPSFTHVATLPCKTVVLNNRKLHCRPILKTFNDNEQLHNKIICSVNLHKLVDKSAYGQCATKNDVQNVHRQPAHKLTNDDATDESLL